MKNKDSELVQRQLVVSVDTEEEGLWNNVYSTTGNTTENLRGLARFQATCESHSMAPTYVIDAPVLCDELAIADLRRWQDAGTCEVGTHCHPWCNPPLPIEPVQAVDSFLCNLPPEVQRAKLEWLTDAISDAMGRRPTSYRAGRYGFDDESAMILDELGYVVDSSVLPVYDYRSYGGPNFNQYARTPYRYFGTDKSQGLIEIPVTAGFTRAGFESQRRLWLGLRKNLWSKFRVAGIADRLRIAKRVKLTPEGTTLRDLKDLIDSCVADGLSTLVLMLHSSSLVAGFSPYAKDEEALDQLYQRLTGTFQYAIERHGFAPATLTQAAENIAPSLPFEKNEFEST